MNLLHVIVYYRHGVELSFDEDGVSFSDTFDPNSLWKRKKGQPATTKFYVSDGRYPNLECR